MKTLATVLIFMGIIMGIQAQSNRFDINESFSGINEIEVNMVVSDLFIEESESGKTDVNGYVEWEDGKKDYSITAKQSGTSLIVKVHHPKKGNSNCSGKLYITAPKNCKLELNGVSGDVNVVGVGTDIVECNTVSGDVAIRDIACDSNVNTVSGDMVIMNVDGDVETNTVSGDVALSKVKGDFDGNSVSGDYKISQLKGRKSISTLSGDVE